MNKESFVIGRETEFVYHGTLRVGVVEAIKETLVTLKIPTPEGTKQRYQSFLFEKIGK